MTKIHLSKRHPLILVMFATLNMVSVAYAVSPNIVISQVYGGGGNTGAALRNDFIELFNRGSAAANLNGMSVQYASSTGTTWAKTDLTNITLQPGQYYLVQEAQGAGGTTNLPTPDATGTIAISGTSGKVALVSNQILLSSTCPTTNVVDFIGFGSANCSETSPTPVLSNTTAGLRVNNGCTDTDNNSSDFTISGPIPRNTATALSSCGGTNVNLSVSANSGNEISGTVITVTATASVAVIGNQTVNLAVTGTGITAGDYGLSNIVITIPNGATTGSVTFTVLDDGSLENTEIATLTISSPSAGISLGNVTAQNIALADNEDCGLAATKISEVQGSGTSSPLINGTPRTIEGIVVGDYQGGNGLQGFFVQEENADADANPATSEGIFIFDPTNLINLNVRDRVRVSGTVSEFSTDGITEITTSSVQVCALNQTLPTAATLTLPVPNVPNGNLATATSVINAYFEAFEGMLVTFPTKLKVSEYFELERFGQLVLRQGGRIPSFTNVSNPSTTGNINHLIKLAKRQIILDDGNDIQNFYIGNTTPLPYPTGGLSTINRFRGGDTITNLTGVLQFRFGEWRLRPVEEIVDYNFLPANPRKPTAPPVGGTLKVTGFNVLNYFTTIDTTASDSSGTCGPDVPPTQDCRGADSASELTRQTAKAAAALCGMNVDIIGLMEIENNASASLSSLVGAANAIVGCGPYNFIDTGTIGGDAIKVGLLYKTSTVTPVGSFGLLTSSIDARFIDTRNRPVLAQTFSQIGTGEKLTVAVNHLKSKGDSGLGGSGGPCTVNGPSHSPDCDQGDGQGFWNPTRTEAAKALVDWLNSNPTGSGDLDYLIIGDLNSYAKEDPIKAIENGPDDLANGVDDYTNLLRSFGGSSAYSYVFDGQTGSLDYALASKNLRPQVTGTDAWHINADEPPSFDYNDSIRDTGEADFEAKPSALPLYTADQYRTSDHDPIIVGLQLAESVNIINGTAGRDTTSVTGTAAKDRITGFGGADVLKGGLNADEFVYVGTGDGIDTIMDFTLGEDKIVLTALLQSLGYQGSDPLAEGIVKFTASGSNTIVYIDPDGTGPAGPAVQRALIVVNGVSVSNLNNAANFIF